MKITSVEVTPVLIPQSDPGWLGDVRVVVARVRTDNGLEGIGYTMLSRLSGKLFFKTLTTAVEELGELAIGENPHEPEKIHSKMIYPANFCGPGGVLNIAACAIDVAVWDLIGKDSGQPLWRLVGGASDRVNVYDSDCLGAELGIDALQQAAAKSIASGHRAMKMRPGADRYGPLENLAKRVQAIREVIGYEADLMMDVNQTWTPKRAIRAGRRLEEFQLYWIEDPTLMHDVDGQAAITAALDTPICGGEYHADLPPLLRLLRSRAVDILMVDLMRMGGITQFRKVIATAQGFGTPVVGHLLPEIFAHLLAGAPNGLYVEGEPWVQPLFQSTPQVADGQIVLTETPGHGLELDEKFIAAHAPNE